MKTASRRTSDHHPVPWEPPGFAMITSGSGCLLKYEIISPSTLAQYPRLSVEGETRLVEMNQLSAWRDAPRAGLTKIEIWVKSI